MRWWFRSRSGRRKPPNPTKRRVPRRPQPRLQAGAPPALRGVRGTCRAGSPGSCNPELVGRRSRPAVPRLPLAALWGEALKRFTRPVVQPCWSRARDQLSALLAGPERSNRLSYQSHERRAGVEPTSTTAESLRESLEGSDAAYLATPEP